MEGSDGQMEYEGACAGGGGRKKMKASTQCYNSVQQMFVSARGGERAKKNLVRGSSTRCSRVETLFICGLPLGKQGSSSPSVATKAFPQLLC